jgi:hypothetical protein
MGYSRNSFFRLVIHPSRLDALFEVFFQKALDLPGSVRVCEDNIVTVTYNGFRFRSG